MSKKIGFIGLGHMGLPMALNLCKAGFAVYVHSHNPESEQKILAAGGHTIGSYGEMGQGCDVVITIVPADQEIEELYLGEAGILAQAREGLVCIDMTSAKGLTKAAVAKYIEDTHKKVEFIDAPVSGGVAGATNGTLTIMAGCTDDQLARCEDVFAAMGKTVYHTGAVGSGSNVKMLNQMLNAANAAIAAEVLCLSRELGIDDKILYEVVCKSSGSSFVFEKNVPKFMMTGDHTPGFRLSLMKKDVGLCLATARQLGAFTPVSELVGQVYQAAANSGKQELNYTAIHKWLEENQ